MVARFWVGGTGTWDASDTTHWASVTNGAGGQTVPTSVDDVTFDASSGGGIVTVNGNHSVFTFSCGAFTGTIDWSINNNNFTVLGNTNQWSGSGTRTMKLGSGNFYFDIISLFTTTNLTWTPGTALINMANRGVPTTSLAIALSNTATWPNMSVGPDGGYPLHTTSQSPTITNLNFVGPVKFRGAGITHTVTNMTCTVTEKGKGADIRGEGSAMTFNMTNPVTLHWSVLRYAVFSGATVRAYNSLDAGLNSGISISTPKYGRIIGG